MCAIALRPCSRRCARGQPTDFLVVGDDAIALDGGVIVAIDHDQPDALGGQALQQVGVARGVGRRQDDAVHLALPKHLDFLALLARILVRAAEQQAVAARLRAIDSMPATISTKNECIRSGMTMPSVWVRRSVRLRATALGW